MANITETRKDENGREYLVYDDGTEKWADNGYFKRAADHAMITTSERGRELANLQHQQKRDAILRGAQKTLEATGEWENPTRSDVAEALGQVVMERAMDPDYKNQKQIEAARFILSESGMSDDDANTNSAVIVLLRLLDRLDRDVIDGEVVNG